MVTMSGGNLRVSMAHREYINRSAMRVTMSVYSMVFVGLSIGVLTTQARQLPRGPILHSTQHPWFGEWAHVHMTVLYLN